jgi:PAS domain S-box-containing protein
MTAVSHPPDPRTELPALALQRHLAALVASSDDAIIGKTLDGTIVSWNPGAERLYGYTPDEVIGRSISLLLPDDHADELPTILHRLARGERIAHYETVRRRKDGVLLDISVTISPIRDNDDLIVGASAIARDITERKQLEVALRSLAEARDQALAEAREALRIRDQLLASVSHDLRTPLTTIKGQSQVLMRLAGRQDLTGVDWLWEGLGRIDTTVAKMMAQLSELVDLALLQAGRALELRHGQVDLVALVHECVAEHQQTTDRLALHFRAGPDALVGEWDGSRLTRVVDNLLSNAIKYSPDRGTVAVTVAREREHAVIAVQDQGLGIPAADLPHIFERFRRGTNVTGRIEGTGIGLAGVKQIVEQHGGGVAIDSKEGEGTTVTVRLPLGQPD